MSVDSVYEVANGESITLPGLSEEERVIGETINCINSWEIKPTTKYFCNSEHRRSLALD
jgi:hypothetical protein